jgi:hypothetical protein
MRTEMSSRRDGRRAEGTETPGQASLGHEAARPHVGQAGGDRARQQRPRGSPGPSWFTAASTRPAIAPPIIEPRRARSSDKRLGDGRARLQRIVERNTPITARRGPLSQCPHHNFNVRYRTVFPWNCTKLNLDNPSCQLSLQRLITGACGNPAHQCVALEEVVLERPASSRI